MGLAPSDENTENWLHPTPLGVEVGESEGGFFAVSDVGSLAYVSGDRDDCRG